MQCFKSDPESFGAIYQENKEWTSSGTDIKLDFLKFFGLLRVHFEGFLFVNFEFIFEIFVNFEFFVNGR